MTDQFAAGSSERVTEELDAGEPGRVYVADHLATQGALAEAIANSRLDGASIRVIVPFGCPRVPPFDRGGVMSSRASREHLCRRLRQSVDVGAADTILVRHLLALPNDPALQDRPTRFAFHDDEVYGVAQAPLPAGRLEALVGDCETALGVFVAAGKHADLIHHGDSITEQAIERFARRSSLAAVDVFDGESYALILLN